MKEMISQLAEISKKVSGKRSIINNITIDSVGLIKIEFDITKKTSRRFKNFSKKPVLFNMPL